jgi:hypothetical protein
MSKSPIRVYKAISTAGWPAGKPMVGSTAVYLLAMPPVVTAKDCKHIDAAHTEHVTMQTRGFHAAVKPAVGQGEELRAAVLSTDRRSTAAWPAEQP